MNLYKHQKATISFLLRYSKSFCFNDTGTGKTLCVIIGLMMLFKRKTIKKVLVITTKSCVKNVWEMDFFNMFPFVNLTILNGSEANRIKKLKKGKAVFVINHDGIKVIGKELLSFGWDVIAIDESTAYKNHRCKRTKLALKLCANVPYTWLLTGTPAAQSVLDYYGQGKFICPENVKSFLWFRDQTMKQVSMHKWIERENVADIIEQIIQPAIRFTRQDCLDLPPIIYINRKCEFSKVQNKAFNDLQKECITYIEEHQITAVNEGVMRSKLLQVCSGAIYNKDKIAIPLNPQERLETLLDLIHESARGVLVFTQFVSSADLLANYLNDKKVNFKIIRAQDSTNKRFQVFHDFQNKKIKVLIAHPRIMGHGVTLTHADTVVWYCVTSDNELYEQANSRINRIGQINKMRVVHLYSTTFELKVLERLSQKRSVNGLLLEMFANKTKEELL